MTPEQKRLISTALSLHQAGQIDKAIEVYNEALVIDPMHTDTLLFIAIAHCQKNEYTTALQFFKKIPEDRVSSNPNFFINFGLALSETGELENAVELLKKGAKLDPEAFEPQFNLGRCYFKMKEFTAAKESFTAALKINANDGEALSYQGAILIELGEFDDGLELLQRAFTYSGETSFIRSNIGIAFERQDNNIEAQKQYERSISIDEKNISSHLGLSRTYAKQGKFLEATNQIEIARKWFSSKDEAILECNLSTIYHLQGENEKAELHAKNALHIDPESTEANGLLALAYSNTNRQIEAVELFKRAISTEQPNQMHLINMSKNYTSIGMTGDAIATAQQAFAIDVTSSDAFSSLLLYLHYPSNIPTSDIASLHKQFGDVFSKSALMGSPAPASNTNNKPKIGFISGDFCVHPVQFFLEPLLKELANAAELEVILFSNTPKKDQVTERFINYATKLIDIRHLDEPAAYQVIKDENLDALIDLSGHTNNNRLPIMAMKPARVQLTYLGYPDTTGLREIDFRLTDNYADPITRGANSAEELYRFNDCFLTYLPPEHPEAKSNVSEMVTFGSFNNIAKISDETIRMWCEILKKVENSQLLIKCHGLSAKDLETLLLYKFTSNEIDKNRILFADRQPKFSDHLELYNSIDIALDTFPYNGTTTTFEALLMGRPVITLRTDSHVSSVGRSILTNLGLEELTSDTASDYIQTAIELSSNKSRLDKYHTTLSQQLLQSKLCDSKLFYKKFVEALAKIGII